MQRYRLRQGKLRHDDQGEWVKVAEVEELEAEAKALRTLLRSARKLAAMQKRWSIADAPLAYQKVLREMEAAVEAADAAEGR